MPLIFGLSSNNMYVARLLYPVMVLGPHRRLGIWLSICHHHCKGCSNPELWEANKHQEITVDELYETIWQLHQHQKIEGFTITGGDPFYQSKELSLLVEKILMISDDIILYSGFTFQELKESNDKSIQDVLSHIAVLIDGRYIEEENDGTFMVGSKNQNKIILNPKYKKSYEEYFQKGKNQIQNFMTDNGIVSVGIHRLDFDKQIRKELKDKYGEK